MSFIIVLIVSIIATFFAIRFTPKYDWRETVGICSMIIAFISWCIAGVMAIFIIVNNIGVQGVIASNEQRYDSLIYQLENNLYDNDNDLGKKELYNQIQKWNEDLAKGKAMQHDFWFGIFYPDMYDQFEYIELK